MDSIVEVTVVGIVEVTFDGIVETADADIVQVTVDGIVENFKKVFDKRLENFGLMKPPYAFYDGVKAPEKKG